MRAVLQIIIFGKAVAAGSNPTTTSAQLSGLLFLMMKAA